MYISELYKKAFFREQVTVSAALQSQGVKSLPSWTIWLPNLFKAAQDTALSLTLPGWASVNIEKSGLSITFIGVALDAATVRACPSLKRVDGILRSLPLF